MFEATIYNIAVMVAGIYLFHRLQYSENKIMIFSKGYVTILMTLVALLITAYPIPFHHQYLIRLTLFRYYSLVAIQTSVTLLLPHLS